MSAGPGSGAPPRLPSELARQLVEAHGTPAYVYDLDTLRLRYRRLRAALPSSVEVLFAVKANPHPGLLETLVAEGAGLEVASAGELRRALSAGAGGEALAFAGPAKRDAELEQALELGLTLNVESEGELLRAEAIAGRRGLRRAVSVRVNPPWGVDEEHAILGGKSPTKFGVDLDRLPSFLEIAAGLERISVAGLHVFCATNVLDAGALLENAGRILDLAAKIESDVGLTMRTIDLGGGLGVPYAADRAELDVERFGAGLAEEIDRRFGGRPPRLILEPGRWLVAEVGTYLTRVLDRKSCRGRDYLLCDGGIHQLLRPALIGQAHPIHVVGREHETPTGEFEIGGPLCTSLDHLGRGVALPDPRVGDLLAVSCAGAYGYTESMLDFLSHPRPPELLVERGRALAPERLT